MRNKPLVAPSLLSADFSRLASELTVIADSGADWVHLDIMDGHFVPNLTFGPPVISSLRAHSKLPFDVHLMIDSPEEYIQTYIQAGSDRVTFHIEACRHSHRYLCRIRELKATAGISLNPQTPINGLEYLLEVCDHVLIMTVNPGFSGQTYIEPLTAKIAALRNLIDKLGLPTLIEVDGGIDRENAQRVLAAGADVLVMGSAFFKETDKKSLVDFIKNGAGK